MKRLNFLGHLLAERDGIQVYVRLRIGKYGLPNYYSFEIIDSRHLAVVSYQRHFNNFKDGCRECLPVMTREEFYRDTKYQRLI